MTMAARRFCRKTRVVRGYLPNLRKESRAALNLDRADMATVLKALGKDDSENAAVLHDVLKDARDSYRLVRIGQG